MLRLARYADAFAIGTAVALPWSRTLTSILLTLWLIALVPTLNWADVRREIAAPAGGLPILLFAFCFLGMAWTHASWPERLGGFDAFIKFLFLPLFFVHFRRSDCGIWVMVGYLSSCIVLLAASWILMVWPGGAFTPIQEFGVPINSAAAQCGEFAICSLALLFVSVEMFRRGSRRLAAGALALMVGFLSNIVCIAMTDGPVFFVPFLPLVIIPLLGPLLFLKKFEARAMISLFAAGAAMCAVLWVSSDPASYRPMLGDRPMFWERSLRFIGEAPVLGHGTGAMPQLFVRAAAGQTGDMGHVTTNPFQQTLAVGIQVGFVGIAVLWAMWIAHLFFFRGNTLPEWVGFVVVIQNIFGSMLDSHLSGSLQGWTYVIGVGVAGGMVRRLRAERQSCSVPASKESR